MSESRAPVVIEHDPAVEEETIDLDDWVMEKCGGDELQNRLMQLGKQMYGDAMALSRNDPVRVTLMRDAANVFSKLIGMRESWKGLSGGGATPPARGGVAVAQITRDDAVGSYMRLIEGPGGDEQ
jgi:hypothetical protein